MCRTNFLCRDDSLPFENAVELIRRQVFQRFRTAGGPANLQAVDPRRLAQSKVDTHVILREITASAVNFVAAPFPAVIV